METHKKEAEKDTKVVHLKKIHYIYKQTLTSFLKTSFAFLTSTNKTESQKVVFWL